MNAPLLRARSRNLQQGYTLVEISVALLIGLFLIGGLLTVVQDNKRTYANQNQLSQLQDQERLAMTMIANVIQSAGYFPNPTANTATGLFPAITAPTTMAAGQYLAGSGAWAATNQSITIRYATPANDPNKILTCNGAYNTGAGPAPTVYTSTFSVSNGQLVCTLRDSVTNTPTAYALVGGTGTTVNITKLQVRYGFNHSPATGNSADSYRDASQIAATDWPNVVSVWVTMTFTPQQVGNQAALPAVTFTRVISLMNAGGIIV